MKICFGSGLIGCHIDACLGVKSGREENFLFIAGSTG
jgi:hypothetical protein